MKAVWRFWQFLRQAFGGFSRDFCSYPKMIKKQITIGSDCYILFARCNYEEFWKFFLIKNGIWSTDIFYRVGVDLASHQHELAENKMRLFFRSYLTGSFTIIWEQHDNHY